MKGRAAHWVGERETVFASIILRSPTCVSIFSLGCDLLLGFVSNSSFSRSSQLPSRAPGSLKGSGDDGVNWRQLLASVQSRALVEEAR